MLPSTFRQSIAFQMMVLLLPTMPETAGSKPASTGLQLFRSIPLPTSKTTGRDIVSFLRRGLRSYRRMILTAGPDDFGGQSAYQIFFQGTDSSQTTLQHVLLAVEGRNDFGAYLLVGSYPKDSETDHTQIYNSLTSFRINGPVDITYERYCDTAAGIQCITDSTQISSTRRSSLRFQTATAEPPSFFSFPPTKRNILRWSRDFCRKKRRRMYCLPFRHLGRCLRRFPFGDHDRKPGRRYYLEISDRFSRFRLFLSSLQLISTVSPISSVQAHPKKILITPAMCLPK